MDSTAPLLDTSSPLAVAIDRAVHSLQSCQRPDGTWWFTLEANESIGAGFVQLMHFLGDVDPERERGLCQRILSMQQPDGSWPLFFDGPGDLSVTVECYLSLRLAGHDPEERPLRQARGFILSHGGLSKVRVFTRIHLALFGLMPWRACPSMPPWLMLMPVSSGLSIYEFSSWARASIVPLLIILDRKPVVTVPFTLGELPFHPRDLSFPRDQDLFSWRNLFIGIDRLLKGLERLPWHPLRERARGRAIEWVREHIARTEDIYPAMAYAAIAMKAAGLPSSDPTLRKAVEGLKRFQQVDGETLHQQCCISPIWDTPWAGLALIEAGVDPGDPALLAAGRAVLAKEIRDFRGDWRMKNREGPAGGWSFEIQNDFFPDVDDTIQVLAFLKRVGLARSEKSEAISRGIAWLLSMQSKNGGWAAFDRDNVSNWVNKIPFSDHGACLDPPTPDVTGRMVELLASFGYRPSDRVIERAIRFIQATQEPFGAWRGRWGVNYLYGTWCVLTGFARVGWDLREPFLKKAVEWLSSIQNPDGGWGESCLSDARRTYVPLGVSVPSQTAWAVMGLLTAGESDSPAFRRGIDWLVTNQAPDGTWEEPWFTGTGFPGHFYLKYHGYAHYFPLMALGLSPKSGSRNIFHSRLE